MNKEVPLIAEPLLLLLFQLGHFLAVLLPKK